MEINKIEKEKVLEINVNNRDKMIQGLMQQVIGPYLDFKKATKLTQKLSIEHENQDNFYYWEFAGIKEEVFKYDDPLKKYISGRLFPQKTDNTNDEPTDEISIDEALEDVDEKYLREDESEEEQEERASENLDRESQSSMGMTFAVQPDSKELHLNIQFGIYEYVDNYNQKFQQGKKWYFRKTACINQSIDLSKTGIVEFTTDNFEILDKLGRPIENLKISPRIQVYIRKNSSTNINIVTVSLVNDTVDTKRGGDTERTMFQVLINCKIDNNKPFRNYPRSFESNIELPHEDKKFEMLHLHKPSYGFGHGCSIVWDDKNGSVIELNSSFLPQYEIETMTPDITILRSDGKYEELKIRHVDLVLCQSSDEVRTLIQPMISAYKSWLEDRKQEIYESGILNRYYRDVADENMNEIQKCIDRIEEGLELLSVNQNALRAFKLANLSMLMQMENGKVKRDGKVIWKNSDIQYEPIEYNFSRDNLKNIDEIKLNREKYSKISWRAFQIGFLLMSISGIVNEDHSDREIIDLIWFPTGGGKTEAYLVVASFVMLYRRLSDPNDIGMSVLMRYTLRLLTADQFQRASRLIVSLEFIRRAFPDKLGSEEFSIGLYVGSSTTPNSSRSARYQYNNIIGKKEAEFPVSYCPWCGAKFKVVNKVYHGNRWLGRKKELETYCPDKNCEYHERLPLYFVDQQLYKKPPTLIIGTVDKFVQLSWKPQARKLFGLGKEGERLYNPPSLIIQDEFHLISGPLGTLTGIYEILIEELCTHDNKKPKIIAATATIRDSKRQVLDVFGRDKSTLFPPSGLAMSDNFFSTVKKVGNTPVRGKIYVGVFSSAVSKVASQQNVLSALLQSAQLLPEKERDPFWTILSFYNSLRDIGVAKNLTQADIPQQIKNFFISHGEGNNQRYIEDATVMELTSRIKNAEITESLDKLKREFFPNQRRDKSFDLCLASNIIEVGVDIDRLSLMTIIGQPKTNAQYIQVSGRVGRKTDERPGLVVTVFSGFNNRDLSHFEHFVEYHQKLYGQVESTSTTPFSQLSIERGLPAVLIGYIRQNFSYDKLGENFTKTELINQREKIGMFVNKILSRADLVDDSEKGLIKEEAYRLLRYLSNAQTLNWRDDIENNKEGLIFEINEDVESHNSGSIPLITSMRSVDMNSRLCVRQQFDEENDWWGDLF